MDNAKLPVRESIFHFQLSIFHYPYEGPSMNFCLHSSARTVQEAVERAKRAEALGFEAIFFADSQMNNVDPYQAMALCAVNTKTLRFGTAVTNMVYRDPTITANSFATLNEISAGRAIVGIGTGDGPVYSLGRSATKLIEFEKGLRVIRNLLHDRGVDVAKSKERAGGNVRLNVGRRPVPIYISAEGPKTLRVAGRTCDGVILGTDFLLERFTIAGTPAECIAKVQRLEADGIKRILLTPPNAIYDQVMDKWGKEVIHNC